MDFYFARFICGAPFKNKFSGKKLVRYVTQISAYFNKLYVFTILKASAGQSARIVF